MSMAYEAIPVQNICAALMEAEQSRRAIEPITVKYPRISLDDAYRIQLLTIEQKILQGARIVGKKAGLTSRAIQELFGVNEPDFGHLLSDMIVQSGETISRSDLIQPKAEMEIAFVLDRDLRGPGVTTADVISATRHVLPALEIIDSRITDWKIKLADTVADNASSGRVVVGEPADRNVLSQLEEIEAVLEHNGNVVGKGVGAAVLGHPANAVAWLANKLSTSGQYLAANELIMPGALCTAIPVQAGDTVRANFQLLGSVQVKFI